MSSTRPLSASKLVGSPGRATPEKRATVLLPHCLISPSAISGHAHAAPRTAIDHAKIVLPLRLRYARQQANDVANVGPIPYLGARPSKIQRFYLAPKPRADIPEQLLAKVGTVDREQSHDHAVNAEALDVALAQLFHHQLVVSIGRHRQKCRALGDRTGVIGAVDRGARHHDQPAAGRKTSKPFEQTRRARHGPRKILERARDRQPDRRPTGQMEDVRRQAVQGG
ncbi:hypothetical protein ACVW1A_000392 [Bradyrhizobium sp. LB1.3]